MSWTTPQDILDRWVGGNAPTDTDLLNALIADAEAVILSEFPQIQARITAETLALPVVVMVVSRMVIRVLKNPDNVTYWQQTTGPFGQARNFGETSIDIWLTPEEEEMLSPKRRGKAFEVDLAPYSTNGGDWIWLSGNGVNEGYQDTGFDEED